MNKTLVRSVNPTFTIGGFDAADLYNKYSMGAFNDITLEQIKNIRSIMPSNVSTAEILTDNQDSSKFVIVDNRGIRSTLVSTNVKNVSKCHWCRSNITGVCLGLPVKHIKHAQELKFETEGCYCSFECAYAEFIKSFSKDPMFLNTESYLNYAFSISYPNQILKPAPDWRLHECNGGPLTTEKFHQGNHKYYDTGRLKCIPVSRNYIVR